MRYLYIFILFGLFLGINFGAPLGYSHINVSTQIPIIPVGGNNTLNYSVNLTSGVGFLTSINISNQGALAAQGIKVVISNVSGEPPFFGVMNIYAKSNTTPGPYIINLSANGGDPTINKTEIYVNIVSFKQSANTTTILNNIPTFIVKYNQSIRVFDASGASLSVGGVVKTTIPPGTDVLINGYLYDTYNVSLYWLEPKYITGPNNNGLPAGAFGIAVNGQIDPSILFVNAQNKTMPIDTIVYGARNDTSWGYIGGGWYGNNTYVGGGYSTQDNWSIKGQNIENNQFNSPIIHVLIPYNNKFSNITTVTTTSSTTTIPNSTITNQTITNILNTTSTIYGSNTTVPQNSILIPNSSYNVSTAHQQSSGASGTFIIIVIIIAIGAIIILYLRMRTQRT